MSAREDVIQQLVATRRWGDQAARIGERAGYRCEYCDRDLLASADEYRMWQEDHIDPNGSNDMDNLALSCSPCNMWFKGKWSPRAQLGSTASRDELVKAVRAHVFDQRTKVLEEICRYREIVR